MTAVELEQLELPFTGDNKRWDEDWDNENSSARRFERSRIKALAGERVNE